jgi:hypothetical protein
MWRGWLHTILFFFALLFGHGQVIASSNNEPCEQEEIYLELRVHNALVFDLDGYICGVHIYLPVRYLLSTLKIRHEELRGGGRITADWPMDSATLFRFNDGIIRTNGDSKSLAKQEMFYSEWYNDWMVEKEILEEVLEMELDFRYRELRIYINSSVTLPVVKEYNRVRGYRAFGGLDKDITPDIVQVPGRRLLSGFAADWSLNSSISKHNNYHTIGMRVGGNVLGGDMLISGRVSSEYGVNRNAFRAFWRFPFYNSSLITQVTAGINTQNNIYQRGAVQYTGVEITNRPLHSRYYFDDLQLSGELESGWDVEFYSGGRLTEVVRGLEGTKYQFQEPLRYGSNRFLLRYFSPLGFSHEEEFAIQIPRTLLPKGNLEYSLEAGRYDFYNDYFVRAGTRMGITRFLTLGGGHQVTDSFFNNAKQASFLTGTLRAGRLLVDAHHTLDYMTEADIRFFYRGFRSIDLRLNHYQQSSSYNRSSIKYEGTLNASVPVNLGRFRPSFSFFIRNSAYERFENTSINTMLSANIFDGYHIQARYRRIFRSLDYTGFESVQNEYQVSVTKRFFQRYSFRPGLVYDQREGVVRRSNIQLRSSITRNANFSMFYERDHFRAQNRFAFTFRYNFNFANYNSRVNVRPGGNIVATQNLRGATFFDSSSGNVEFDRRYRMNSSVIRLEPYFVNDNNEAAVDEYLQNQELNATVYRRQGRYGARIENNMIKNLIPYEEFIIKIDPQSFDNPHWQPQAETFSVQPHPYGVNTLRVPVMVMGEAEGRVIIPDELNPNLARGLRITLRSADGSFVESVVTYSEGKFYYVGLPPGDYVASLDAEQLATRSVKALQDQVEFTIRATARGDIVDNIYFHTKIIRDD